MVFFNGLISESKGMMTSSHVSSGAGLYEIQSPSGQSGNSPFFVGLLNKGFKDLSLLNQCMENVKILINGHSISKHALLKADKKSGTVCPGSYW
jgi:hypothetical protein